MRIIHRGFILVGTPLLLGLLLTGSLFALMEKAERERIQEADARKAVSLIAREMVATTELICLTFASIQTGSDKITAQYKKDLDELSSNCTQLDRLVASGRVKVMSGERMAYFKRYTEEGIKFWKSKLDASGNLTFKKPGEDGFQGFLGPRWRSQLPGQQDNPLAPRRHRPGSLSGMPGSEDGGPGHSEFASSFQDNSRLAGELQSFIEAGDALTRKYQDEFDRVCWLQTVLVALALLVNPVMGFCLARFYQRTILERIGVIARNTERLASQTQLLPQLDGNDEIAQLDRSFHEMHRQIQHAAENEKNLFNNASDVICVLDAENRFLNVNPASSQNWEYEPQELTDSNLGSILPPGHLADVEKSFSLARDSQAPLVFETPVAARSGKELVTLWSTYWSKADSKLYCIVHDITDRKRIENMRAQFVGLMSSDLKQPLAGIAASVSLVLEGAAALSQAASDKFSSTKKNVERLIGLVNELLEVAEIDTGILSVKKDAADFAELLNRACQDVEPLAREKNLAVEIEAAASVPADLDADRIMQVLVNLLSNAIKFSPEGKSITLSAGRQGKLLVCRVTDQGRGIPAAQQELIFEKFSQVKLADGKRTAGTGLGLPICKLIVEAHGGEIGVDSREGEGSSFWFRLPAEASSYPLPGSPAAPEKEASGASGQDNTTGTPAAASAGSVENRVASAIALPPALASAEAAHRKGLRLSLARLGIILVGVPVLFELIFAGSLILSLLELQNERNAEKHQREIVFSACKMVNAITARITVNRPGQMMNDRLEKLHEVTKQWLETERHLGRLIKGDRQAEGYLEKVERASEVIMEAPFLAAGRGGPQGFEQGSGGHVMRMLSHAMRVMRSVVIVTRNLSHIIDHAEAVEFRSPEKELALRDREKCMLVAGLAANLLVSLLLALQFSLGISRRLAVMVDNTGRVAREEPLNPQIPGNDELSDLDDSFHKQSAILVESRRKERAVFDNCQDALCTISSDGLFVSSNPAASALWGYSRQELAEISVLNLVVDEEREVTRSALLSALDRNSVLAHECRMTRNNGTLMHCLWSASARKEQGALFCIFRDITDKKKLDELRQDFLSLVSHDLRTPLTAVCATAELAREGYFGEFPPAARAALAQIVEGSKSLTELINDILDLEKLEAGKLELIYENTTLQELVADLEKLTGARTGSQTGSQITVEGNQLDKPFKADKERLGQAIANVFTFMSYAALHPGSVQLRARHDPDGLEIILTDTGPLLAESVSRQIFERFKDFSADNLLARQAFHADLRLPLAARIIERHGGSIRFEKLADPANLCRIMLPTETG
jgi:PAS domain S-box-containing protein